MKRRCVLVAAVLAACAPFVGCAGKSNINAYLLEDANVGGDPAKSVKPIKSVLIWPLENIAGGSKSKGVETRLSGILADTVTLESNFERVVILEEDQAKDLMARAGEELGLKKKPKAPLDGALIATKLGQLSGTESILIGRIEDYDEDKVDKAVLSIVSGSFNLLDAREKAYAAMDSFTPVKRVWRTHVKRASKEGPFNSRESIDDTARAMIRDTVARMTDDLGEGAGISGKALAKKVAELLAAAEKSLNAGEFDKAVASYNEVLKAQPDNRKAKRGIEETEKRRKQAEDRAKAAALKKQTDEIRGKALEAEKAGNLEGAIAEWKKIAELDKQDKQAAEKVAALEKEVAAQKAEAEKKAAAEKKAKEEADRKTVEKKAAEPKPEARPEPKPEAKPEPKPEAKPEVKPEVKPAAVAAGDLDAVRNQAMAAFNKEDYQTSRDLWKQILEKLPDDKQAKEMLETTEMLLNALK